jgi:hypothetical protein
MKIIDLGVRLITEQISKVWTSNRLPYYRDYVQPCNIKLCLSVMPYVFIEDADDVIGACFQVRRDVPNKKILYGNTAQFFKGEKK